MVSTVGPVSNSYPPSVRRPVRPPGTGSRSTTVTSRPAAARCSAQASPPSPAPTMTTCPVGPVTVFTRPPSYRSVEAPSSSPERPGSPTPRRSVHCKLRRLLRRLGGGMDLSPSYELGRLLHRRHGRTYYLATR